MAVETACRSFSCRLDGFAKDVADADGAAERADADGQAAAEPREGGRAESCDFCCEHSMSPLFSDLINGVLPTIH